MDKKKRYYKADLHIHTPVSTCYSDKSATPEQIISAALGGGLEVLAVTDHNTCEGIENISRTAAKEGLIVFPGVEISTKEGHFVAIFDVGTPISALRALLNEIGFTFEAWGDGHIVAKASIESVLKKVHDNGGITIASHIDRWPSGFLETKESRQVKRLIHASEYLDALEITIPQNKKLWNEGLVYGYPRQRACIQSSDAHSVAEIGRRPVFIELERLTLADLRKAFRDYRGRIIFPEEMGRA